MIGPSTRTLLVALVAAIPVAPLAAQGIQPDLILHGGKVVTVDGESRIVQAVSIRDGRIMATGSDDDVLAMRGPDTELLDLAGRTVLPGFFDGHIHLVQNRNPAVQPWRGMGLIPAVAPWLRDVLTVDALERALEGQVAATPPGEWIIGDLNRPDWPNPQVPKRDALDRIAPRHPVAISRGPHTMVLNSLGLERAGITRDDPQPPGGWLDRDAEGELTGLIFDGAQEKARLVMPPRLRPDRETVIQNLVAQLQELLPLGITSVNVASVAPPDFGVLQELYRRYGEDLPRMTAQLRVSPDDGQADPEEGILEAIRLMESTGFRTDFGDERLDIGAIKMVLDGGLSAPVFWSLEPYEGRPDFSGVQRVREEVFYRVGKAAHDMGWQLGIHTIGDAATEMAVNVFERILQESPRDDHRHYLHHVSVKPPEATLRKMAALDIWVNSQPNFSVTLGAFAVEALAEEREATQNPQRSLVDAGIRVAYGSDRLPFGPLTAVWAAVTRIGFDGAVYGPQEAVTVEEAIRFHTLAVAEMNFDEEFKGSIEPGKVADLVVLGEDVFTVDPLEIKDVPIDITFVDGKKVYSRN